MIRNLLLASVLTLGIVVSAQADSDTSPYPAVTSSNGELVRDSNSQTVTVGGAMVEPESDRGNEPDRGRASPGAAPGAATGT
jgi:hypothetical protein